MTVIDKAHSGLGIAVARAEDCRSFGEAIIDHQAVGFSLTDLRAGLEATAQLVLSRAALGSADRPRLQEASTAELFASGTAEQGGSARFRRSAGTDIWRNSVSPKPAATVGCAKPTSAQSDVQRVVNARGL